PRGAADLRAAARRPPHRAAAHRAAAGLRRRRTRGRPRAAAAVYPRGVHPARSPYLTEHARRRAFGAHPGASGFPRRPRAARSTRRSRAPVISSFQHPVRKLPILAAALLLTAAACSGKKEKGVAIVTQPVQR